MHLHKYRPYTFYPIRSGKKATLMLCIKCGKFKNEKKLIEKGIIYEQRTTKEISRGTTKCDQREKPIKERTRVR